MRREKEIYRPVEKLAEQDSIDLEKVQCTRITFFVYM